MTEGVGVRNLVRMAKGFQDGDKPIPTFVVVPAKAGIQEGEAGEVKG